MAMVVKNNMSAVSTLNTLNKNSNALQKSLSKVSSGMKINSAQDDASGYAISERMRVQIRSLDQANQNTQNGSSMMKTAEGAVSSTVEILKSLKEKAINAANDTNKDSDRVTIQKEIDQFIDQIDDNALTTFNGKYLVDGSKSQQGEKTFTAMTNQSLAENTTGDDKLIALKNRNGESLEIASTDYVTASFVQNGNTYTTKFSVGTDTTLKNVFENLNDTYQKATNKTTAIFGAANTDTSAPTPSMTTDEAIAALTGADATLANLAAAVKNGSNATDAAKTLYDAAQVLKEAGKGVTDVTGAPILGDSDTVNTAAKALSDAIAGVTDTTVTVTNNGAGAADVTAANGATVTVTYNEQTYTATNQAAIAQNGTEAVVVDISGASGDIYAAVSAAAKGAVDNGNDPSTGNTIGTAATATVAVTGTNVASTPTSATLVSSDTAAVKTAVENYAKAYAYDKLLAPAAAGDVEILSDTKIGKNAAGDMVYTADGTSGLTVTAANGGVAGQVSGLTISITDSEGNVKKSANASLDAFSTTIYAKNKSDRNELSFQVGAAANQAIAVGLEDMRSEALGLKGSDGSKVSVATQDKANAAVAVFDNAIQKALDQQTTIGSIEARLEYTSQNLTTSSENVQAAESTIRDADMAKEMTNYTKNNVLLQAAQSMLAQANQSSSAVLSLLQ